jgi:hypothetical protein
LIGIQRPVWHFCGGILKFSCIAECGEDLDLVNPSGSMMEISDNFAKKEKKSGSFVQ